MTVVALQSTLASCHILSKDDMVFTGFATISALPLANNILTWVVTIVLLPVIGLLSLYLYNTPSALKVITPGIGDISCRCRLTRAGL